MTGLNLYRALVFPVLSRLDPETTHDAACAALAAAQSILPGRLLLRMVAGRVPMRPVEVCGLRFPNAIGVAAGFDKNVRIAPGLGELGFGHVEVGTLTPRPQPGNERPRVFRLPGDRALINRMGFPNDGVEAALPRLRAMAAAPRRYVLGVSLGKQKDTPLEDAGRDYIDVMRRVYASADYLAVNVSSPNTPGLRELQGAAYLESLLGALVRENERLARRGWLARRPLFVKIAPDMELPDLDLVVDTVRACGIDGIIATNTTLSREGAHGRHVTEQGGLSGAPLAKRATAVIDRIARCAGAGFPIIGVGGVFTARDVQDKMDAGACLVQVYTGFVYEGPGMAGRLVRGMR